MAKLDFKDKDYYRDLELQPNADTTEIKKQFKKLAMKYHPDRNPGTGEEVKVKFQTIQAAYEVLSNPDTKSQYDAQRRTTRAFPTASGVRGNPWSHFSQHFPTPPQRGNANTKPPNPKPPNPPPRPTPSASSRYSNFGFPPSARSTRQDPQTRYEAWENMKGGKSHASASGQSHSKSDKRAGANPPPAPTARTASQRQKAEASFGNRKTGFVPQSPVGDEPPVSNSNYFSSSRHTTMFPETPVKTRRASHMDPGTAFRDSCTDDRQSTPYRSHIGEKLNPFDGATNLNRAKSTRESARTNGQETENPPRRHKSSEDMSPSQNGAAFGAAAGKTFAARMDEKSNGVEGRQGPANPTNKSGQDAFTWNTATKHGHASNPENPAPPTVESEHTAFRFPRDNVAYDSSTANGPFMTSSAENINTSFVAEDHAGTDYQFNAGGPLADAAAGIPTPRRTQSGSRLRRRPTAQDSRPARPAQSAETLSPDRGDTKADGFKNEDWQEQFSALNFAPPAAGVQISSSPTRGPRQARKPRPSQQTMGSGVLVDDDVTTSGEDRARQPVASGPMPANAESPNAMDIDPPLSSSNGARNINVEPSRPDWRAGDVRAGMPEPPARPPKQPVPSFSTNNAAGSEDTDDFRANLADLKNIAPLAPSGSGFESLNDLKSSLPFESKASARLHLNESPTEKKTSKINFPRTPIAPRPPPTLVVPNITPTARAWEDYVSAFSNYLHEWHHFNARFIDHFQARRGQIETQRRTGGFSWLYARGNIGMDEYMDWVEQDQEVRARWTDACNEHAKRTAEFKAYRKAYLDKLN